MKYRSFVFSLIVSLFLMTKSGIAQPRSEAPDFSSLLSLFSANAISSGGVRINWSLDSLSPTIVKFRLYRGYEDVGNFAVLTETVPRGGSGVSEYSFTDTTARSGVTYFYKIAALLQSSESIFPVVISATPDATQSKLEGSQDLVPAQLLKDEKIALYVRRAGRVKLEIISAKPKVLVDDLLRPGIYEFDLPSGTSGQVRLKLNHEEGFSKEIAWPVR
jgi:hypothetical protein